MIIWDRGGAGRPVLVWPGSPHQAQGTEILSFAPRDHWCLGLRCIELPPFLRRLFWDLFYRLFVYVSGCVWLWVRWSIFKWVCANCWDGRTFSVQTQLCSKCQSITICKIYSIACLASDWQWLTVTDTVPDTSGQTRCSKIQPCASLRKSKA